MGLVRRTAGGRQRRGERGQGLIEISILLPFFLIIIVGVVEVADSLNTYVTLVNSSRDGARLGANNLATDAQITSMVLTETDRLRDPVTAGDVTITHTTLAGTQAIRVKVCNRRTLMLRVPLVMPDNFNICATTMMRLLPAQ